MDTGSLSFTHVLKDIQTLNEEHLRNLRRNRREFSRVRIHQRSVSAAAHGASIGDNTVRFWFPKRP